MRVVRCALGALILASPALAQDSPSSCLNLTTSGTVIVRTETGGDRRGVMICLTEDEVTLLRDGNVERMPLTAVKQIVRPADRDSIWDGAYRGVAFAPLYWLVSLGPFREDGGRQFLRGAAVFAALGAGVDALQTGSATVIFAGTRPRAPAWRLRF